MVAQAAFENIEHKSHFDTHIDETIFITKFEYIDYENIVFKLSAFCWPFLIISYTVEVISLTSGKNTYTPFMPKTFN